MTRFLAYTILKTWLSLGYNLPKCESIMLEWPLAKRQAMREFIKSYADCYKLVKAIQLNGANERGLK